MSGLERGSHIAQIVSAVAVVVSIIYLAQQIQENTAAVSFETNRGLLELQFQQDAWDQDPVLVELMQRGDTLPESLSSVEWEQYSRRWALRYNVWWLAYSGFSKGTLDPDLWAAWNASYAGSTCLPGAKRVWEYRRHWWSTPFQRMVEEDGASC
jgi:hypothetical protein